MHDAIIDATTIIALVLSILLLGYLTLTMLFPEKF
jgi:K+-transporting ATPase KdpF subunit